MRLIDADKLINDLVHKYGRDCSNAVIEVDEQPEAVVRCKDCKYAEHWYGDKARCFLWSENGIDVFEDGYCNYGKRREDD